MNQRDQMVTMVVNGYEVTRSVEPSTTLLEFLREELGLTGTKKGCDLGECGCCTVLVGGKPALSCLTLALEMQHQEITTIEGLAHGENLHPVQKAFVEEGALQCGYCTPAMILNGVHLLNENPTPTAEEIKECVSGTLCRCTGYVKIEKAVARAAKESSVRAK